MLLIELFIQGSWLPNSLFRRSMIVQSRQLTWRRRFLDCQLHWIKLPLSSLSLLCSRYLHRRQVKFFFSLQNWAPLELTKLSFAPSPSSPPSPSPLSASPGLPGSPWSHQQIWQNLANSDFVLELSWRKVELILSYGWPKKSTLALWQAVNNQQLNCVTFWWIIWPCSLARGRKHLHAISISKLTWKTIQTLSICQIILLYIAFELKKKYMLMQCSHFQMNLWCYHHPTKENHFAELLFSNLK